MDKIKRKVILQNYSIALDVENVEFAENIFKRYGGKLSPFMNSLLTKWREQQEKLIRDDD